jgi:hypothetical protein
MSKYGNLSCPDCGTVVEKASPNMKRCKPCALKAHRQTGIGFAEKSCEACGVTYKPTGAAQRVCQSCKPAFHKEQARLSRQAQTIAAGRPTKGSIIQCSSCGDDFVYKSSVQHRCPECQRQFNMRRIHEWLAANPEYDKAMREKTKDKSFFGGKRKAALERDNHTCQHCGTQNDLQVHHIDGNGTTTPKEQRNNALENLLTLCRGCHTRVHHKERGFNVVQTALPKPQ